MFRREKHSKKHPGVFTQSYICWLFALFLESNFTAASLRPRGTEAAALEFSHSTP